MPIFVLASNLANLSFSTFVVHGKLGQLSLVEIGGCGARADVLVLGRDCGGRTHLASSRS